MNSSTDNKLRTHLGTVLLYSLAYYLLTFPALHTIDTHLLCDAGDGLQNFWNNWWIRHAVANGKNPWFTDYLYAPDGISLVSATLNPFNGFATIPLCWFVNPVTAYNLMVVFAFVAGGYTTFLLAREMCGAYWPSVFAGAAFTFGSYHFAHALGHMQLISLQWLPLFFFAWIRLLRRPGYGRATLAAAALFLNLLCDYYYTLYSILGGAILFVCTCCFRRRPLFFLERTTLLPLSLFVLLSLVSCGPLLFSLLALYSEADLVGGHGHEPYVNDLFAGIIPGASWRFHATTEWFWGTHPLASQWVEFGSHVGITTAGLAGLAIWQGRTRGDSHAVWSLVILGAVFYLLSLGPILLMFGEFYPDVPMPFELLESVFPMIELSGVPVRMAVVFCLTAAVLAAMGLHYCREAFAQRKWLLVLFLALFAVETLPRPQATFLPRIPAVAETLRDFPDGIVTGLEQNTSANLLYQTGFEKPVTAGYVARAPRSLEEKRQRQIILAREGRYADLMDLTNATYLFLRSDPFCDLAPEELKCVATDGEFAVFTRKQNALPEVKIPLLTAQLRFAGGRAYLDFHWPEQANRKYLCMFSKGVTESSSFQTQPIELARDAVFELSLLEDDPVFRNLGTLDAEGRGTVEIDLSKMSESKLRLWYSVGLLHPSSGFHFERVSRPRPLDLSK